MPKVACAPERWIGGKFSDDFVARIDAWIEQQPAPPSRIAAVRALAEEALAAHGLGTRRAKQVQT
jgi:hypothetical protein